MTSKVTLPAIVGTLPVVAPALAYAGPGSDPLINFGQSILNFLTGPLAYVVFGLPPPLRQRQGAGGTCAPTRPFRPPMPSAPADRAPA